MQALSDAKAGENYTIKWMFGLPEVFGVPAQSSCRRRM